MKYRIVQRIEGQWLVDEVRDNLEPWLEGRGFKVTGKMDALRYSDGKARRIPLRPELHNAPIVAELTGPMWDGDAIRYEDEGACEILSR